MNKDKLTKMLILNISIVLVNIFMFSPAFLNLKILGGNAFLTALSATVILMSTVVFGYGNYKLLNSKEIKIRSIDVKNLDDCMAAINQNRDKKTFIQALDTMSNQIKSFKRKETTIDEILLQKFNETEMSYQRFKETVGEVEKVIYLNIMSLLNRINAFDEQEYLQITKSKNKSKYYQSKMEIFKEYKEFAEISVDNNEQIILKLDKLLLEISKFNSIEDGEVENMDAMKEIDELIENAKWYKNN